VAPTRQPTRPRAQQGGLAARGWLCPGGGGGQHQVHFTVPAVTSLSETKIVQLHISNYPNPYNFEEKIRSSNFMLKLKSHVIFRIRRLTVDQPLLVKMNSWGSYMVQHCRWLQAIDREEIKMKKASRVFSYQQSCCCWSSNPHAFFVICPHQLVCVVLSFSIFLLSHMICDTGDT